MGSGVKMKENRTSVLLHKSVPSFGRGSGPLARRDDDVEDDENEDVAGYFEE